MSKRKSVSMKDQSISLRKFIETFKVDNSLVTEVTKDIGSKQIPDNFKDLDYFEKNKLCEKHANNTNCILTIKDNHICLCQTNTVITRIGNKIFLRKAPLSQYIYIESNRINLKCDLQFILAFFTLCNIDWYRDIPQHLMRIFFVKSSVFRAIITHKIYNEETFYKFIEKRVFGIKNIGWRFVKKYCLLTNGHYYFNIFDLRDFTRNLEDSIDILTNTDNLNLYYDLLTYAVKLNQIVDFKWSIKRINLEHQKQIRTVLEKEIEDKDEVPIYKNIISGDNIKLLNSEKEVFIEAKTMHHCLYNCYFDRIQSHNYIAFHMSSPEDCTFSAYKAGDGVIFDQIYLSHDRPVQENTRLLAQQFIKDREQNILECFKEPVNNEVLNYFNECIF